MIIRFLVASWILSAAFALDTNRGQEGAEFQAEHFVVLHDERNGWVRLSGNGKYPNPAGVLAAIPDSKDFAFQGSAEKGMTVKSSTNRIELEDVVRNWVIGGFSMGIARGELRRGGEVRKLYGFPELIL